MVRRSLIVLLGITFFFPLRAFSAPPAINPATALVPGPYSARGQFSNGGGNLFYMNRNQLLIRLTGCEYAERATDDNDGYCDPRDSAPPWNARHWGGSFMEFVERIVNEKLLAATYYSAPPTNGGSSATTYTHIFRNYVDLIMKRLLDTDKNTPLDYDNHTFRYVDRYNPALSESVPNKIIPGGKRAPTKLDTNGDYIEGGWEPSPLLSGTCFSIPFIQGGSVCINMYVVSVTQFVTYQNSPAGVTPAWSAGDLASGNLNAAALVNNVGGPMIDFDPYDPNNQFTTSHLFLAGEPNRLYSFDSELASCTAAELIGSGNCDQNPFRDDDDSLAIEIQLTNFRINVLFEPPFNPFAMGTSKETDKSVRNPGLRHRQAYNISDVASSVTGQVCYNDAANDPGQDGVTFTSGYDPACDLSQYLKAWGIVTIPILKLVLNARVVSVYKDNPPEPPSLGWQTADTINLGLELQSVLFDTNFIFALNSGPYCNSDANDAAAPFGKGMGQDGMGIFYDRTDHPNNCFTPADGQSPNVVNDSDDATYLLSEQINAILPYIRGDVEAVFRAFFNPNTNPGIYFGPTRLLNLNETIGGVSIANPLGPTTPVTEYIWLQLSLDSNVDSVSVATDLKTVDNSAGYRAYVSSLGNIVGDNTSEFWADPWGVMMPFSSGMGLFLSQGAVPYMSGGSTFYSGVTPSVSCVTTASSLTGYKDGYGPNRLDDPFVSRPLPNLALTWSGSGLGYGTSIGNGGAATTQVDADSVLLGLKIPNVNGMQPFALPTSVAARGNQAVVPFNSLAPTFETYALGVAIHENFLSKLLYEAIIRGLLCIWIDPTDTANSLGANLGSFLTTDLLGFFVPYLADNYPGQSMAIRVLPLLASPGTLKYNSPPQYQGERIRQYIFFDPTTWATSAVTNPIPRIQTGGLNLYDPLKQRFLSAITTANLGPLWPDLSVIIPHLLVEFYVVDQTAGKVYRRAFALDIGINIGLNIDIVQDPGVVPGSSTFMDPITGRYPQLARPAYSGTNFPIGCRTNGTVAYNCEITGVPSRLVIFLGGIADPELNAILIYDEMASVITFPAGTTLNTSAFAFPNTTAYVQAISNLIGLLLSGELSAFVEIGFDPAAWLNVPLVITVPYIGPSYVIRRDATPVQTRSVGTPANVVVNPYEGCGAAGNSPCGDPIFGTTTVTRDISDSDLNGFGDYLVAAVNLDLSYFKADYLIRLIDAFVEQPVGGYACNGKDSNGNPTTDVACVSEAFVNPFSDLLGGGLFGAPSSLGFTGLPQGYVSPETIIKGVRKAHALETIIEYEGWHPSVPAEQLTYSWRVDGGFWTPFVPATIARIPGLLEGTHVFEVKAKDPQGNVEYTPARLVFTVDSVAPRIRVLGDRVQSGTARFLIDATDSQTLPEAIRVSYRVDGGEWSPYTAYKEVAVDLAPGHHTLEVRALDEAGNEGVASLTFVVEKGGFGCSLGSGNAPFSLFLLALFFLPALLRLRRVSA